MPYHLNLLLLVFFLFVAGNGNAQTIITPKIGMEVSFPKYLAENDPDANCPTTTSKANFIAGLDATQFLTDNWMLSIQIYWTRYSIQTNFICSSLGPVNNYYKHTHHNLRTGIGVKYMTTNHLFWGLGFSLDYRYKYNYFDAWGVITVAQYQNHIKDLGINLSVEYVFEKISVSIKFNQGLWAVAGKEKRRLLRHQRDIEPLSSLGVYFGYRFGI